MASWERKSQTRITAGAIARALEKIPPATALMAGLDVPILVELGTSILESDIWLESRHITTLRFPWAALLAAQLGRRFGTARRSEIPSSVSSE